MGFDIFQTHAFRIFNSSKARSGVFKALCGFNTNHGEDYHGLDALLNPRTTPFDILNIACLEPYRLLDTMTRVAARRG